MIVEMAEKAILHIKGSLAYQEIIALARSYVARG